MLKKYEFVYNFATDYDNVKNVLTKTFSSVTTAVVGVYDKHDRYLGYRIRLQQPFQQSIYEMPNDFEVTLDDKVDEYYSRYLRLNMAKLCGQKYVLAAKEYLTEKVAQEIENLNLITKEQ